MVATEFPECQRANFPIFPLFGISLAHSTEALLQKKGDLQETRRYGRDETGQWRNISLEVH